MVINQKFSEKINSLDLSVIICTFNRSMVLSQTLQDFLKQKGVKELDWELLVIDNNSTDDTRQVVESFQRKLSSILKYVFVSRQGKNYALNHGIREARGRVIAFTDDDVRIDEYWISNIMKAVNCYSEIGFGGRVLAQIDFSLPRWVKTNGKFKFRGNNCVS